MQDFTVGVEEEYQLVDPETGELASRARDVLAVDWKDVIRHEIQETMLEAGTPVCASAADLDRELRRLRFHVASVAAVHGLVPVAAGLHPFSRWQEHRATADPRYGRLLERYGHVLRTEHIFGMHVHVAVPEGCDRIVLINRIRPYLPLLLALSASSPFFEGVDTSYASYRTILAGRLPCSGPPPAFVSERQYRIFVQALAASGAIEDQNTIYWSARPHPIYPTIEVRCADVCPRVEDAVTIAALVRSLVAAAADGRIADGAGARSGSLADALCRSNEWQVARNGLDAAVVGGDGQSAEPVREALARVTGEMMPIAESLGDEGILERLPDLLARGNGAQRIRAMCDELGNLREVVAWTGRETLLGTGMGRRGTQRNECA